MKTYSRIVVALLILTALLLAMSASAQEKSKVTTIKPRPSVVLDTRANRATPTPTPTPKPRFRFPGKISVERRLPDVFNDRDQQKEDYPRMPGLAGVEVKKAEATVRQIQPNARISVREGRYTNNYEPGVVVYHTPERGAFLKPGAEVVLYYNPKQSPSPKMPNLIGMNIAEAEMRLFRAAPRAQSQRILSRRHNPNYGDDVVIGQSPEAGTELSSDVRVVLYVNPQPPRPDYPKMPDLVGMDLGAAQARLSSDAPNYPQRIIEESEFNPRFRPGVVVNQSPRAGMPLQPGGVAVLYYNPQQPQPKTVSVPDVMGLNVPDAARRIEQNNLVARFPRRGTLDNYIVTGQSPQAGAMVEARSAVTLTVTATVVVPDVRRSLLNEAQQTIGQNRLTVGSVTTRISTVRQDEVLSQSPAPNSRVVEGTAVNLVIAKTQQVQVPNVLNQQQGNAEQALTGVRLAVGQVTKRESPRVAGTVLDQNPRAGTMVNIGSQVSLVIAEPETVPVPDLRNKAQGAAQQMIASARLVAGQVTTRESPLAAGTVLGQSPPAGTRVTVGSQVSFVVAMTETAVVPDLRNKAQGEAWQLITNSRLIVGQVTKRESPRAEGTVLDQNPPAGTRVNIGSHVGFVVAVPETAIVPDLRNRAQGEAQQLIASVRLTVGQVTTQQATVAAGTVLSQNPQAGTVVNVGSSVNFVVAVAVHSSSSLPQSPQPPPPSPPNPDDVVVPDLVKKELPEAINSLRAARLVIGDVKEKESGSFIVEQEPAAGQRVKVGTRVNVFTGKKPGGGQSLYVLLVAAFGFGTWLLARLWKRLRTISPPNPDPPQPPVPALSFRSTMNANSAEFAASTDLQTGFSLRFLPKADWGQQHITLTGGFVAAESEEL